MSAWKMALEALEKLACLGNGDNYGNSHGNVIAQDALKAIEAELAQVVGHIARPNWYQNPTSESWFECPDDADILESVDYEGEFVVGTEYELDVCWSGVQRFRVIKIADDASDDIEVVFIGGKQLYTAPKESAVNAELLEALKFYANPEVYKPDSTGRVGELTFVARAATTKAGGAA